MLLMKPDHTHRSRPSDEAPAIKNTPNQRYLSSGLDLSSRTPSHIGNDEFSKFSLNLYNSVKYFHSCNYFVWFL